jgi:CRP/FNR family nitrogen fixation transcriptional regulator
VRPQGEDFLFADRPELPCARATYAQDEEIYREGAEPEFVYRVVGGAVRAQKRLDDGRRQIGAFHLPGDIFGLELRSTRRLSAEAVTDTKLLVLKRSTLEHVATHDIELARRLWRLTARDLDHAHQHILLLGRKVAGERVAAFLLEMDRRMRPISAMSLPMMRRDIADYLGLTVETVSRAITEFRDKGFVTRSAPRKIGVNGYSHLRAINAEFVVR